jgi:ATP-binding cassette subfamily B protein
MVMAHIFDVLKANSTRTHRTGGQVLQAFLPLWRKHRKMLFVSYGCGLLAVGMTLLSPWPLKFVIDHVLGGQPLPEPITGLAPDLSSEAMVLILAGVAALIGMLGAILSSTQKHLDARVRERMALELRDQLLSHIQTLPLTLKTAQQSGELVLRIVDDVHQLVRMLTKTAPVVFQHLTTTLSVLTVMFWLEPRLALLGLVLVSLMACLIRFHAKPLRKATRQKRRGEGAVAGLAQEVIRGLATVQALGAEERVRERFSEVNSQGLNAGVRETQVAVAMERNMQIANAAAVAMILGGGGMLVINGYLSLGGLTVCIAYMVQLLKPVEKINELATSIARGLARGEEILALLDIPPAVHDHPYARHIGRVRGRIDLRSVYFAYPPTEVGQPSTPVLENINLKLQPGSFSVLLGPSGSGKSTLLSLLLRLYDPVSGGILLDGIPYSHICLSSLRTQFAAMLQHTHLFTGTLRDSLQPVDLRGSDRLLWWALEQVALDQFVSELPGRLDAVLGEDGMNLSGGQRARLSLARALLLDRPILLLDEPLANVDAASQRIILEALERFRVGRTCLAVTHQPELAERADVILYLEERRIAQAPQQRTEKIMSVRGLQG